MLFMNVMTQRTIWFVVAITLVALLLLGATLAMIGGWDGSSDLLVKSKPSLPPMIVRGSTEVRVMWTWA